MKFRTGIGRSWWVAGILTIATIVFHRDLQDWFLYGRSSSLYAYTLMVPWIVFVMMMPSRRMGWFLVPAVLSMIALYYLGGNESAAMPPNRIRLFLFVLVVLSSLVILRGTVWAYQNIVPAILLLAAIPLPAVAELALNDLLQVSSAIFSQYAFQAAGIPVYREGLHLLLPGLTLHVDPSCSGIRSTLILFVAALVTGHVFLRRAGSRVALVIAVVPLGILRNALRIVTLGVLTLYVDPETIRGPLHLQGGPLFFAASLVLLLLLARWLVTLEKNNAHGGAS